MPTESNSTIVMYGATPLGLPAHLERVLDVLEKSPFAPTGWSFDERTNLTYDRKDILSRVSPERYSIYLRHRGKRKNEVSIELGELPEIRVEFEAGLGEEDCKAVFDLADQLGKAYRPDISVVYIGVPYEDPWKTDRDRDAALIHDAAYLATKDYRKVGPIGLAPRTYLGPHYVVQFGKELLLSTPAASVRDEEGGGITIDLTPMPWKANLEETVEAWRRAMAHLGPAEIFAITEISKSGLTKHTRAPRCHIGGGAK